MRFQKFNDFLKERELGESHGTHSGNDKLNRPALDYDRKLAQFNARFNDPKEGEHIVKLAGYKSVGEFLSDPDERKWSRLKIPGQENYTR